MTSIFLKSNAATLLMALLLWLGRDGGLLMVLWLFLEPCYLLLMLHWLVVVDAADQPPKPGRDLIGRHMDGTPFRFVGSSERRGGQR